MRRAALVFAGLAAACSSDQQETHYMTLVAAHNEGAVHRGWIPAWLPKNANTLKEKHDADNRRSIVRFAFPESDKWSPPETCRQAGAAQLRASTLDASWWPAGVPSSLATPRYVFYACAQGREFLAVDFKGGEALHWRPQ